MNGSLEDLLTRFGGLILSAALLLFPGCLVGGCQLFEADTEPIERAVSMMMADVVGPAVAKAADELSTRSAMLQGQGSVIDPGYRVDFAGGMFNGVQGHFVIRLVGVSGNLAGAAQGDAGQAGSVPPPVMRTMEPVEP